VRGAFRFARLLACWGILCSNLSLAAQDAAPDSKSLPPASQQVPRPEEEQLPKRVRVSIGVSQGLLIKKVAPKYPESARRDHIQGTVLLLAEIGTDGAIHNLRLISGEPSLAKAAIKAVKQWKYKPYYLKGKPVEVETQIQVNFALSG
jgi:TonB family protein